MSMAKCLGMVFSHLVNHNHLATRRLAEVHVRSRYAITIEYCHRHWPPFPILGSRVSAAYWRPSGGLAQASHCRSSAVLRFTAAPAPGLASGVTASSCFLANSQGTAG